MSILPHYIDTIAFCYLYYYGQHILCKSSEILPIQIKKESLHLSLPEFRLFLTVKEKLDLSALLPAATMPSMCSWTVCELHLLLEHDMDIPTPSQNQKLQRIFTRTHIGFTARFPLICLSEEYYHQRSTSHKVIPCFGPIQYSGSGTVHAQTPFPLQESCQLSSPFICPRTCATNPELKFHSGQKHDHLAQIKS